MRSTTWHRLALIPAVLAALAGCEASFVDQRGQAADTVLLPDAGRPDSVEPKDDGGPTLPDAMASGVLASGTFEGRAGHAGKGTAELVREQDGRVVLRFGSDFSVSAVPGPVVLLSSREALGTKIDPAAGDLKLGTLSSSSGAQSYVVPGGDGGRRWAWVFCEPFAVEIARAKLTEVQP